jgi:hypothetical protein
MNEQAISKRQRFAEAYLKGSRVYTIRVPKDGDWDPVLASTTMQQLLSQFGRITFCITADRDQIAFQVLDLWHKGPRGLFAQAIYSIYPQATVEEAPYVPPEYNQPFYRSLILYRQAGDFEAPLKTVEDLKHLDPLVALVQAMRGLAPGDRIIHWVHVMGPASETVLAAAKKRITVSQIHPLQFLSEQGMVRALGVWLNGSPRAPRFQERDQRLLEDRLRHGLFHNVFLMTQVDVQNKADLVRISTTNSGFGQFDSDFNALRPVDSLARTISRVDSPTKEYATSALGVMGAWFEGTDPQFPRAWSVLSVPELAGLWHLPHKGFTAPEILYQPGGMLPLPTALARNTEGVVLGVNRFGGQQTIVRMRDEDREKHINVIGKTGVGKSTLIHAMIHQDIQDGKGVGVVDPHGQLVTDILRNSIPDRRIEDVVVLDFANEAYPPPLNPMVIPGEPNVVANGQVVAIVDKIYDIKAQRADDSLAAALETLKKEPVSTVRDVVKLFIDVAYRHRLVAKVANAVTSEFWEVFERMSPSLQKELSYPVMHRMRHFYRNPTLYPILCHPDALDFASLIAQKKIILVSLGLDERKVPATEKQLLGALTVSQLQMAGMEDIQKTTKFHEFIDETEYFSTTSLDQMLAEARKFGVNLCLVNQFLGQLKGSLLESVIGNVGATVVFQCGLTDAKLLAPYFGPEFTAQDLMNLPVYQAAVKMRHAGQTMPAFSLETLPPPRDFNSERAQARERLIRSLSVARYTPKTRAEVLAWLDERYPRFKANLLNDTDDDTDINDWSVAES